MLKRHSGTGEPNVYISTHNNLQYRTKDPCLSVYVNLTVPDRPIGALDKSILDAMSDQQRAANDLVDFLKAFLSNLPYTKEDEE